MPMAWPRKKPASTASFLLQKLIKQLIKTPGQELATHTYSHYYCLEQGQTREQFAADLDKVIEVAQYVKTQPRSLVFPRNQWNPDYVLLCAERGITQLRSNPNTWFWNPAQNTLAHKIARTGDAYVPLSKMSYSEIENHTQRSYCPTRQPLFASAAKRQTLQ
jgi:hypothetical protein